MTYVMSDIHGNLRRFESVMKQINLQPEDTLYVLGDLIDRHPDGIRILRKIMAMPNVKMLPGNHEFMMLQALDRPFGTQERLDPLNNAEAFRLWYRHGGRVTHRYWKHIRKELREEILHYLHSLQLNYDIEVNGTRYKLVHGAPAEEYEYFKQFYSSPEKFSVWKRWRPYDEQHGDYTLIFGHTPTMYFCHQTPMKIWYGDNRIGIDCGCGFPEEPGDRYSKFGRLACLRLDDMREFYSEENYGEGDENQNGVHYR